MAAIGALDGRTEAPPRLRPWERIGLALFALLILAFGALTELRSSYQHTRKTDFGVYLRAAYAVRSGGDIYQATDDNGYHYTYPPAFAVAMAPLADAPADKPRTGLVPFPVSVALWTIFNFLLVGRIVHVLAMLVFPSEPRGSRRWWYARTVPVYAAFGGLFYSIGFGQVNVLVVAMLVEMLRGRLTGRSLQSGLWLAAAIVIKVFPAYLLLYPLMKRDKRAFLGVAIGLTVGLVVIPVAGLGLAGTEAAYRSFTTHVLFPGAFGNNTEGGTKELFDPDVNDNQSFLAVIHKDFYADQSEPALASKSARWTHNAIAALLTLLTLAIAWRRGLRSPADEIIFAGALMLLMLHVTPMSHMHYYAFGVVLAAGLWLQGLSQTSGVWPGWGVTLPLVVWGLGTSLPLLPGEPFEFLRSHGLGPACSLMLWSVAMARLAAGDDQRPFQSGALAKHVS